MFGEIKPKSPNRAVMINKHISESFRLVGNELKENLRERNHVSVISRRSPTADSACPAEEEKNPILDPITETILVLNAKPKISAAKKLGGASADLRGTMYMGRLNC